jgi:hemerythrin
MSFIEWTEEFSVGIKSIDAQHKKLIEMINELNKSVALGESDTFLANLFVRLMNYTKEHFAYEEELFSKYKYQNSVEHIKQHRKLLHQVYELKNQYESDPSASLGLEIIQFLRSWLINHILKADKDYTAFLVQKGVK